MTEFKMDKTAFKVFRSFEEAEENERAYWRALSPEERLEFHEYLSETVFGDEAKKGLRRVLEIAKRPQR